LPEFRAACEGKTLGMNGWGLTYVPEVYRAPPKRDRSRLLSSDQRQRNRERAAGNIAALRDVLAGRSGK